MSPHNQSLLGGPNLRTITVIPFGRRSPHRPKRLNWSPSTTRAAPRHDGSGMSRPRPAQGTGPHLRPYKGSNPRSSTKLLVGAAVTRVVTELRLDTAAGSPRDRGGCRCGVAASPRFAPALTSWEAMITRWMRRRPRRRQRSCERPSGASRQRPRRRTETAARTAGRGPEAPRCRARTGAVADRSGPL